MNIRLAYVAALGIIMISCKKDLEPQDSSSSTDSTAVATSDAAAAPVVTAPQPGQSTTVTAPAAQGQPGTAQPQQAVAKGMNPAHGQPGHRCDIPVGAPLNSAPKTPAAKSGQAVTINQTPAATGQGTATAAPALLQAPAQETAPGMNPPHGQPGHRCDVPVGQPLPQQ